MERVTVLSKDGEVLAKARLHPSAGGPSAGAVLRASGEQRLVPYSFGEGGRHVLPVGPQGEAVRSRIVSTSWRPGGRLWAGRPE